MKFEISTQVLQKWLAIVSHATAHTSTTPILENILLKVQFKNIILTANNLDMAIEYVINTDIEIFSEGSYCVPSKLLWWYINLVHDDTIHIQLTPSWDALELKTSWGKTKIKWVSVDDFPLIPQIKEEIRFNIHGTTMQRSIEKTIFSTAEWNVRPNLAWIFMHIQWSDAIFASTDSFRLSEYRSILDTPSNIHFEQIIPNKTCYELKNLISPDTDVTVICGENQIIFSLDHIHIFSRLLNGSFPEYVNFFPSNYTTKWVINRVELIQALKKINLISRENNYAIRMSFSSETGILLETSETQIGEEEESLVGSVEGEDAIIGINSTYFLQALSVIETTHISLQFENPLAPILLTPIPDEGSRKALPGQFQHIIMPLKI